MLPQEGGGGGGSRMVSIKYLPIVNITFPQIHVICVYIPLGSWDCHIITLPPAIATILGAISIEINEHELQTFTTTPITSIVCSIEMFPSFTATSMNTVVLQ